jgi:hypothetical protein
LSLAGRTAGFDLGFCGIGFFNPATGFSIHGLQNFDTHEVPRRTANRQYPSVDIGLAESRRFAGLPRSAACHMALR